MGFDIGDVFEAAADAVSDGDAGVGPHLRGKSLFKTTEKMRSSMAEMGMEEEEAAIMAILHIV